MNGVSRDILVCACYLDNLKMDAGAEFSDFSDEGDLVVFGPMTEEEAMEASRVKAQALQYDDELATYRNLKERFHQTASRLEVRRTEWISIHLGYYDALLQEEDLDNKECPEKRRGRPTVVEEMQVLSQTREFRAKCRAFRQVFEPVGVEETRRIVFVQMLRAQEAASAGPVGVH